ncbi:MAG: hydroxyacid dehydrogenase [Rhodospirillaceae bacterium]|nr:hydroxyacid dehydrogenase [Rhodospirillaceae bacterium]
MSEKAIRVLVHDNHAHLYRDLLEAEPGLDFVIHDQYSGTAELATSFGPEVVMSFRFAGNPYPRGSILNLDSVRWIHVSGSGTDHLAPWDTDRITVTNCAGFQANVMAEYAIGAVLAHNFRFPEFIANQKTRRWEEKTVQPAAGSRMLVIGLGPIGRAIARLARAIGMLTTGLCRSPGSVEGFERTYQRGQLHEALAEADVVVLVIPLTYETRGWFDADAIAAMKPDAILINMARGNIVDETALSQALVANRLRGAVIDVFSEEPLDPESPLWNLENAILTPHISSVWESWQRQAAEIFIENFRNYRQGGPMVNVVR